MNKNTFSTSKTIMQLLHDKTKTRSFVILRIINSKYANSVGIGFTGPYAWGV